jgi:hypothetical protein
VANILCEALWPIRGRRSECAAVGILRPARYDDSSPHDGRTVASAAADADALSIGPFGMLGHSGGGPTRWLAPHCCPGASSPW